MTTEEDRKVDEWNNMTEVEADQWDNIAEAMDKLADEIKKLTAMRKAFAEALKKKQGDKQ